MKLPSDVYSAYDDDPIVKAYIAGLDAFAGPCVVPYPWNVTFEARRAWTDGWKAAQPAQHIKRSASYFYSCYAVPFQIAMRNAPGVGVCIDEDCNLSGGFAHAGPCESCDCGDEHAIEECPLQNFVTFSLFRQ